MEGDAGVTTRTRPVSEFQSTPSTWRVTVRPLLFAGLVAISIHTLHMEGDAAARLVRDQLIISIHTLHMEGDLDRILAGKIARISIHTLHMEGDPFRIGHARQLIQKYFNPHPPHGG